MIVNIIKSIFELVLATIPQTSNPLPLKTTIVYKKTTFFFLLSISIFSSCVKQKTLLPSLQETSVQKENYISPQSSESIKTVIESVEVLTIKLAKA